MTIKEQLLNEIDNTPIPMLPEILHFIQFMKAKQPQQDFMTFAGMASDIEELMQEIVEEAEANRHQVTVDYAKANLEELCDRTETEPDGVAIVRENRSYILISQAKWESFFKKF